MTLMRIVLDGRYIRDDFPGIGRYVYNLARALPGVAPDVDVLVLHAADGSNTRYDLDALRRPNLSLVQTDLPIRSLAERARLPLLVRRLAAEVVHAPYHLTVCRTPGRRVVTVHDVIPARHPETLPFPGARALFEAATRLALRTAHRVMTSSEASRRDLATLYGADPDHVTVVPLAADPRFRPAAPGSVNALRRRLGLPERYVLSVGSNKPHKNLVRLIDAWARVGEEGGHRCHLVLAGWEDPRYPEARQRAVALGLETVVFLGTVSDEDLPALYSGAEVFVCPSLYEGFGLPVVEAMACGAPVVCSDTSSLPEVAGDAALFFDPLSVAAIASSVGRVSSDPDLRARLRDLGLRRAGDLSWERAAELTLRAYRGR